MTDHVAGSIAEIGADLAALRRDVAHLADTMRAAAERQAQIAGIRASDAVGDARNNIKAVRAQFESGVEHHPLTAMLIALGVGLVIGSLGTTRG